MPESTVPFDPSTFLATFTFPHGSKAVAHSEAMTLVDTDGEVRSPLTDAELRATPVPVVEDVPDRQDANNSTFTPLADGESFTGEWTSTEGIGTVSSFIITDQPLSTARIEWSSDGASVNTDLLATADYTTSEEETSGFYIYYPDPHNYVIDSYFRIVLENTSGTDCTVTQCWAWVFPNGAEPFSFIDVDGTPSTLSKALLTRALNPAQLVAQFTDAVDGALPSGSAVTIDPVLNAESNVLDSGWLTTALYEGKNVLNVLTDVTGVNIYLMNASDDQGANLFGDASPVITTVAGFPAQLTALFADNFFRIVVENVSGSSMTSYSIRDTAAPESADGISTALNQPIFAFYPAKINRSVIAGDTGDGLTYENVKTDGKGRLTVTSGSEFARLLNRQVEDTEELRLDVEPTSSDYYLGKAPDGTATSASSWDIVKISLSASRNPERIQFVQDADWDNRATAF